MLRLLKIALSSIFSLTLPLTGFAASCSSLSISGFSEGDVVYLDSSSGAWKEVKNIASLARYSRKPMTFYYIANGRPKQRGILVIKSARKLKLTNEREDAALEDLVRLTRKRTEGGRGNEGCIAEPSPPINDRVPGKTYDGYHDYGYNSGKKIEIIKRFHIRYLNRNNDCDSTDNPYGNSIWTTRGSNRSQFSFDRWVVDNRMYYKVSGFVPGAYAASADGLFDRRVLMEPYVIADDRTACIPFSLRVRSDSILRIVDLEGRKLGKRLGERER